MARYTPKLNPNLTSLGSETTKPTKQYMKTKKKEPITNLDNYNYLRTPNPIKKVTVLFAGCNFPTLKWEIWEAGKKNKRQKCKCYDILLDGRDLLVSTSEGVLRFSGLPFVICYQIN